MVVMATARAEINRKAEETEGTNKWSNRADNEEERAATKAEKADTSCNCHYFCCCWAKKV
eukprot:8067748-Heterocapsa_arctica.AAC.1